MNRYNYTGALRIFTMSVACISGFILACSLSHIIYDFWLYGVISIVTIVMIPVALISLTVLLISTSCTIKKEWEPSRLGFAIFGIAFILITFTSIGYKVLLDSPAIILHATFDGRSKVDLYLRENMTVKCEENHMLGVNESYGKYRIKGDTVILENVNIRFCGNVLVSTLIFEEDYIRLLVDENTCSIKNTKMHIWVNRLN